MSIDPKVRAHFQALTKPMPEKPKAGVKMGSLIDRVQKISNFLGENPALMEDTPSMERYFKFMGKSREPSVREYRVELVKLLCFSEENGIVKINLPTFIPDSDRAAALRSIPESMPRLYVDKGELILTEKTLNSLGTDQFWDFIKENNVKNLKIKTEQGEIEEYNERVLTALLKKEPTLETLTEQYTLIFPGGEELSETKATLLLCGEFFEGALTHGMKESQQKSVDLSETNVTFEAFYEGILSEVKTGQRTKECSNEAYEMAIEYLDPSKATAAPQTIEGAFGAEQWAEMGVKVDDVPPIPKVILDREDPDSYLVVLIPSNISFNSLVDKSGVGYDYKWPTFDEYGDKPEDKSYWVAIKKELMPGSHGAATRQEQLQMAAADGIHQAPSLMEAVACNIASYKSTGQSLWGVSYDGVKWLSTCREETLNGEVLKQVPRLVIGGSAAGLFAIFRYFDFDCVGVAPVLREF